VVAAIGQDDGDIYRGKACKNSNVQRFANSGFNGSNELTRNGATDNLVDKEEAVFLVEFPFARIVAAGNFLGELVDIVGGRARACFS